MLMRPISDRRVDILEESASSTIIRSEGGDRVVEVGGEIGADPAGAGDVLTGCAPVDVSADLDRALGRLDGEVSQCLDSEGDVEVDVEGTYRARRS